MTHIELDDQIMDHPKFVRVYELGGSDPWFLWCGLRSYCSKFLSDGFIPDYMIPDVRGPREPRKRSAALKLLKDANLVEDREGGIVLHDYLDHADSREEVLTWRKKARERKRESRRGSRGMSQRDRYSDSSETTSDNPTEVTDTRVRVGSGSGDLDLGSGGGPGGTVSCGQRCEDSFEFTCPDSIEFTQKNRSRAVRCKLPIGDLYELFRNARRLKRPPVKYGNEAAVADDFDAWLLTYANNREERQSGPRVNEFPGRNRTAGNPDPPEIELDPEIRAKRRAEVRKMKAQGANGTTG